MRKMRLCLVVAMVVLFGLGLQSAIADTEVSGDIASDSTWGLAGSPYIVVGVVDVLAGVTLTIEPGVEVRFNGGTRIYTHGTLNAPGTSGNRIIFTRNGGGVEWSGLEFKSGSSGDLEYCTIEYATAYPEAWAIRASSPASLSLDNCILQHNAGDYGFWGYNVNPILTNNRFEDNGIGIYIENSASPVLGSGNRVTNNTTGITFNNCASPSIAPGDSIVGNTSCGIYYQNCSSLGLIDSLILQGNGGYGAFRFANSGDFTLGSNNIIGGSGFENSWPLTIDAGSFPDASSTIPTSGNTNDDIRVTTGTSTRSGTWPKFSGIDYVVTENSDIGSGDSLTIAAGDTVRFNGGTRIYTHGTLNAPGTSGSRIIFTRNGGGVEWSGLEFKSGSSGNLEYCTIEYATAYPEAWAIRASSPASLSLDNCILQHNAGDYGFWGYNVNPVLTNNRFEDNGTGIYIENSTNPNIYLGGGNVISNNANCGIHYQNCSSLGLIDSLTLQGNGGYGAFRFGNSGDFILGSDNIIGGTGFENSWPLAIDAGSFPDASSSIPTSGNTNDDIRVTSGTSTRSGSWPKFSELDYVVTEEPDVGASGSLTIAAGNTIRVNSGHRFLVHGILNAPGTSGSKVIFTRNGEGVEWQGLRFNVGSAGDLDYCTVEHARYFDGCGVLAFSTSSLNVDNCVLQHNDFGFKADHDVTPTTVVRRSIITGNNYGVYCVNGANPLIGGSAIAQNDIAGNAEYGVMNASSLILNATHNWWGDVTGPYDPSPDPPLHNPGGAGDSVSDYVDYSSWALSPLDTTHSEGPDVWVHLWGDGRTSPECATTYSIVYGNKGNAVAESVAIIDTLPLGTSYVKDLSGAIPTITGSGQAGDPYVVSWDVGAIAPDSSFYFGLVDSVYSDVLAGDTLLNTVSIATSGEGPQYLNDNRSSWCTWIVEADTNLVICRYADDLVTGFNTPYYFYVGDAGTVPAEDVVLVAYLDSMVEYISSSDNSFYDPDSHTVTWDIGMIRPPSGKQTPPVGMYRQVIWKTVNMYIMTNTTPCTKIGTRVKCFRRSASAERYLDQYGGYDDHTRGSLDPNDKQVTPQGYGEQYRYVTGDELFHYIIHFENVDSATAAATYVTIIDQLDSDLDWTTLQIGLVGVDTALYTLEAYDRGDLTFNFDPNTGIITFYFENIDLPPNVVPPEGEGFVMFSIAPKQTLSSGTKVRNNATIVFDYNPPIDTPETINTIDKTMPESAVDSLPAHIDTTTFLITWGGRDLHSGIKDYTVYVSQDDDTVIAWLRNTTDTSAFFTGETNHTYSFYSIATDNVGNVEDPPSSPDASITISGVEQDSSFLPNVYDLSQNYPNPFNPTTAISYQLSAVSSQRSAVSLKIYNILGQEVRTLVDKRQAAGYYQVLWNGRDNSGKDISSGVYFYRLKAGDFTKTRKIILLK